jgi:Tol biopolymer transport system component
MAAMVRFGPASEAVRSEAPRPPRRRARRAKIDLFRVSIAVAATTLALCLLALPGAGSAQAAFPGFNGKIAFQSNRDVAGGEIYTITPGGTATRITVSNSSSDPAYSPDGSRIAFISSEGQSGYQVFVMNADGSGRRRVTPSSTAKSQPTWSHDGTQIAYVANSFDVDGQTDTEIWAINADGTARRQLTNNSFPDTQPAWSPLGNRIAFVSVRTGDTDRNVYVMNSDGGGQTSITPNSPPPCSPNCYRGHDDNPAWSPNGSKIAYVHGHTLGGGGLFDIWTMDPSGGGKGNLTNNDSRSDLEPAWSPNGGRIAYTSRPGTGFDIYVMNANGTGQAPIDTNASKDDKPDWQPIPVCTKTVNANNDPLVGTAGKDVLCGDGRDNKLNGAGGNDIVLGRAGNDALTGALGNDTLNGGPGTDTALYLGSTAVRASLATGFATGVGSDVLLGVENLTGGTGADTLTGSAAANVLTGGLGADSFSALAGNDQINARNDDLDASFQCGENASDTDTVNADLTPNDPVTASPTNCEVVNKA